MLIKIVPNYPVAAILDVPDAAEEALIRFAEKMDGDMGTYFHAEPATEAEVREYGIIV